MKIGIDGTPLTIPFPCGTKHYAQELLNALADIDKKNYYYIFTPQTINIPSQANFSSVRIPNILPVLKRQLFLSSIVKKNQVDVFHFLEPYGAALFQHPNLITTVHDLNLNFTYPTFSKYFLKRFYCQFTRRQVIGNSKFLIVVSNFIKEELNKYLRQTDNRAQTTVIHNGVNHNFKQLSKKSSLRRSTLLCLGDFTPRKNIPLVLKAYTLLGKKIQKLYPLTIVTSTSQPKQNFLDYAKKLNINNYINFSTNPSLEDLVRLYNQSAILLYPSLYEGFGIPILEAMACGCPVITSGRGAMKEVAGKAAYLINPESAGELSQAIKSVVKQPRLATKLQKKGIKRAKNFTWNKSAQKTLSVYEQAFKSTKP